MNASAILIFFLLIQAKNTPVSYKMDVNSKLMLQFKCKSAIEDDRPKKKSYKYNDSYLDFAFTFILWNGKEKPQCVICSKVLASESMLPNKLKRHLKTSHPQFIDKPRNFFLKN